MDDKPLVSVIIPVYNTEKYLRQCLDNVVNQTLKDIEIICVDDGSTDDSLRILREYAEKDVRMRVLTQELSNAGAARNHGLRYARGKYLSFLDSDDFFELDMLEKACRLAEETNAEIVVFDFDCYFESSKQFIPAWTTLPEASSDKVFIGEEVRKNAFVTFSSMAWDKLFLTEFVRESSLSFQEQHNVNDLYFVYSAIAKSDKIAVYNEVLAHYRKRAGGLVFNAWWSSWKCFYDAYMRLKEKLEDWDIFPVYERTFANSSLNLAIVRLEAAPWPMQEEMFYHLKNHGFADLHITGHTREYFDNKSYYEFCHLILENEYHTVFAPRAELLLQLKEANRQIEEANQQIEEVKGQIEGIYSSWTYRIGRAVTFIPRKARENFRKIKKFE